MLGSDTLGIGNILDKSVDLFDTPAFFSNSFALGGFNEVVGQSFVVDLRAANVPEPSILLLLCAGLFGVMISRRRANY